MKLTRTLYTTAALIVSGAILGTASGARADVQDYWSFAEWQQAVGAFTTIDFTGWNEGTVITDQYSDLGVTFTDGNDFVNHVSTYVNDGAGLHGSWIDLHVTLEFDVPQAWIGIDHPGPAAFDLYANGELIQTVGFSQNGAGNFSGVVSDQPFDKVIVYRIPGTAVHIDDLHFGIPAPGAIAVLGLAGLLGTGSRRRRG